MSYMWTEFNIKTFAAETIVYRDGVYCADLSTLPDGPIDKKYELPVHIIYVGEIAGKCRLNIDVLVPGQRVVLSAKIKNKLPAFLNIFIKNAGKNSEIDGHVSFMNDSELTVDIDAEHAAPETAILIKSKIIAGKNSTGDFSGAARIGTGCVKCRSDIGFTALCDKSAKIRFRPAQFISAVPESAEHGAAIYAPTVPQIEYLKHAGITDAAARDILADAFINSF